MSCAGTALDHGGGGEQFVARHRRQPGPVITAGGDRVGYPKRGLGRRTGACGVGVEDFGHRRPDGRTVRVIGHVCRLSAESWRFRYGCVSIVLAMSFEAGRRGRGNHPAAMFRCGLVISATPDLPAVSEQADRLVELGVHRLAGWSEDAVAAAAETVVGAGPLLALHPDLVQASLLAPLLNLDGKPGFVVVDMSDVDEFGPTMALPDAPVYLVDGLDRGDAMSNWSPAEADPAIAAAGRTPLTLTEGLYWVLQRPETLERGRCFMTIGSRRQPAGWRTGCQDARRSGSATAPAATVRTAEVRRRSAGAGQAIGTPGSGSRQPRVAGRSAPCADSTNGTTSPSHASGSEENTTWPVGNVVKRAPGMASATARPQRVGAVRSLVPQVINTGALDGLRNAPEIVRGQREAAPEGSPGARALRRPGSGRDARDDAAVRGGLGSHVGPREGRGDGADDRRPAHHRTERANERRLRGEPARVDQHHTGHAVGPFECDAARRVSAHRIADDDEVAQVERIDEFDLPGHRTRVPPASCRVRGRIRAPANRRRSPACRASGRRVPGRSRCRRGGWRAVAAPAALRRHRCRRRSPARWSRLASHILSLTGRSVSYTRPRRTR